jgi:hypothetical protein
MQEIVQPSISMDQTEECNIVDQLESDSDDWRRPIIKYIQNEEEPDDKNLAERIARQSAHYTLIGEILYRRGASGVLRRYHDKAVRQRFFSIGDLVLRRILTGEGRHKLSPLWEGPFIVAEVTRPGSYRLTQMDGTEVGNSWNIEHLRKFYP